MGPMRIVRRLARLIFGADVDEGLRPLLGVNLAGSLAFSSGWTFMGIWAIDELGAGKGQLAAAYLVGSILSASSGYVGGHLSDHVGRRPIVLAGWAGMTGYMLLFLLAGDNVLVGLSLLAGAGLIFALGWTTTQALVVDLVPRERHEAGFAAVRVANNLGVTAGPPIGGLLLVLGDWPALFVGVSVLAAAALSLAVRFLPARGDYSPEAPPERGSFGVIRRDRIFLLFWVSGALAYLVYAAYETVLPISLVDSHGLPPSAWGFLLVINPALVTILQLRLTGWVAHVPPAPKLVVAMLLMGTPFLLLSASAAVPVVAFTIFVFVIGEMLWVPTSQAIVAGLAPADLRGAYMGAFNSTGAAGFALAPLIGLNVMAAYGDSAVWIVFALIGVVAAATGGGACRLAFGRGGKPLPATATASS
jgi:predicted MFS family arabinose efflux permease